MNTKKTQQGIIIQFCLYILLLVGLVVFIFVYLYPQVQEIEDKKQETQIVYDTLNTVLSDGMSFDEFTIQAQSTQLSKYTQEVVGSIDEDFYNSHLINDTTGSYEDFLSEKNTQLLQNTSSSNKKQELVDTLIPSYSDVPSSVDNQLDDFRFINYLESIFETFNISHEGALGINSIEIVEEFAPVEGEVASLETNIFQIPVSLQMTSTKKDLLKFLQYVRHVGTVEIDENNISVVSTPRLLDNTSPVILKGDQYSPEYNIYSNQIIDIESFYIKDYIDSYFRVREANVTLEDFVLANQGDDVIESEINLLFYIQGIPNYKIQEAVNTTISYYQQINAQVTKILENKYTTTDRSTEAKKINSYLKEIQSDVLSMNKKLATGTGLEELYKKAYKYRKNLESIIEVLDIKINDGI